MTPDTLTEIYMRTVRSGNTTAAIEVAKQIGATVVVHDAREEARLKGLGARAVSVERGLMAFAGTSGPYVVDLPVVARAAQAWAADRDRAMKAERRIGEEMARADGAEARAYKLAEAAISALATLTGSRVSKADQREAVRLLREGLGLPGEPTP